MEQDGDYGLSQGEEAGLELELWQGLTNTAGWRRLVGIIDEQIALRMDQIMTNPVLNMEAAVRQEFARGECNGLKLAKLLAEQALEAAKDAVELHKEAAKINREMDNG